MGEDSGYNSDDLSQSSDGIVDLVSEHVDVIVSISGYVCVNQSSMGDGHFDDVCRGSLTLVVRGVENRYTYWRTVE